MRNQLYKLLRDDDRLSMRQKLLEAAHVIRELQKELETKTATYQGTLPSERKAREARYGTMVVKRSARRTNA